MHLTTAEIQAIIISLKASAFSLILQTPFALWLGFVLARNQFKFKIFFESIVNLPQVLPPVITGFILLALLGREGWIGKWFYTAFGFRLAFSFKAVVLASAIVSFPIYVGFVKSAISMVDVGLEQAGYTLGKSKIFVFFTITFPLALPGIIHGFILAFARNLGEFGATITFAGNIAGQTQTIPLAVYNSMQIPGNESITIRLVVVSIILSLVVMALSGLLKKRMELI